MKNNKGFSLVELIIVIAIMAILVGVMAPQLIKYIEKTNVSSDVQLCDTVREAIQTAMMDPSVINASTPGLPTSGVSYTNAQFASSGAGEFQAAVYEILGTSDPSSQIKSSAKTAGGKVNYKVGANSVIVWIDKSDDSGKKSSSVTAITGSPAMIHAGDTSIY
jgi:prepilin-type N-terminal cleavage/methylation domain-containing protein